MVILSCPTDARLVQLVLGGISEQEAAALEKHVLECAHCMGKLQNQLKAHETDVDAQGGETLPHDIASGAVVDRLINDVIALHPEEPPEPELRLGKTPANESPSLVAKTPIDSSVSGSDDSSCDDAVAGPKYSEELTDFLAPPQAADEIGRLGAYRILSILGRGGMGVVFRAQDVHLERVVALKAMLPSLASIPSAKERFFREAKAAAALRHPHVVTIFQVGEDRGAPFLVMEFLEGELLDDRIKREPQLSVLEVLRIGKEIADGLEAAHERGLIHRDIKPGNIWLEGTKGHVKILDFGLARAVAGQTKLTQSGTIIGTPAYMAPEQTRGEKVDHRCDLFSLGSVLYRMGTGEMAFKGRDTIAIFRSLALDVPPPPVSLNPRLPTEFSDLVMQLLAKLPEQRPASCRLVSDALHAMMRRSSRPGAKTKPQTAEVPMATAVETTSADPWQGIDDATSPPEPNTAAAASPETAPLRRSRGRRTLVALALSLLLLAGGGFAAYTLYLESKNGKLLVEVDGNAAVLFQNGEILISDADGRLRYTLKPGEHAKNMPPGAYTVAVASADGVRLDTEKFEMTKDGKVVLRVTALPPPRDKKAPVQVAPVEDPDRRAAEYVLSIGGMVRVNEEIQNLSAAAQLPKEPFRLVAVMLQYNPHVTDAGLACFKNCRNLTYLNVSATAASDEGLVFFKDCKTFTVLELGGTSMSDAGLAYFKNCRNLEIISVARTNITDAGLMHIKDCKNLIWLYLNETKVTDAGLTNFTDCKNLEILSFAMTKVTDTGLAIFKDCRNLKDLFLDSTGITDATLLNFQHGKNLRIISVNDTDVTDAGLAHLKERRHLEGIHVGGTKVTDAGLAYLEDFKYLEEVSVGETKVSDKGIALLRECKNLRVLSVRRTVVTDTGLAVLKDKKKLTTLDLYGTHVTDVGTAILKDCKSLKALDLRKTEVTSGAIDELTMRLPQCQIEWDGGVVEPKK